VCHKLTEAQLSPWTNSDPASDIIAVRAVRLDPPRLSAAPAPRPAHSMRHGDARSDAPGPVASEEAGEAEH
jgi:hypothetical protein